MTFAFQEILTIGISSVLLLALLIYPKRTFLIIFGLGAIFYLWFYKQHVFEIGDAKIYPLDFSIIVFMGFLVIGLLKGMICIRQKSTLFVFLFVLWGMIQTARGVFTYGYSAIGEARWYVLIVLYYFSMLLIFNEDRDIWTLSRYFFVLLFLIVFYNWVHHYILGGVENALSTSLDYRARWRFLSAHQTLLVGGGWVTVLFYYFNGRVNLAKLLSITLLAVPSIVITQHRSVWLAIALGISVLLGVLVFFIRRITISAALLSIIGILGLLISMPILSSVLNQNIISSLSTSIGFLGEPQADRTGSWRLIAWQQELDSALKHPLFGEPFGGYSHWYDGHQWLRVHVHNGYIMYFSKLGLLGLSLFLIAVFLWYVDLWRFSIVTTDPHLKLMAYAFQIILGMFLVFSMFYNFNAYFWVIFAAGTLLVKQNNRKVKLVYSDRMKL